MKSPPLLGMRKPQCSCWQKYRTCCSYKSSLDTFR